jgi:hypothetical protein
MFSSLHSIKLGKSAQSTRLALPVLGKMQAAAGIHKYQRLDQLLWAQRSLLTRCASRARLFCLPVCVHLSCTMLWHGLCCQQGSPARCLALAHPRAGTPRRC